MATSAAVNVEYEKALQAIVESALKGEAHKLLHSLNYLDFDVNGEPSIDYAELMKDLLSEDGIKGDKNFEFIFEDYGDFEFSEFAHIVCWTLCGNKNDGFFVSGNARTEGQFSDMVYEPEEDVYSERVTSFQCRFYADIKHPAEVLYYINLQVDILRRNIIDIFNEAMGGHKQNTMNEIYDTGLNAVYKQETKRNILWVKKLVGWQKSN